MDPLVLTEFSTLADTEQALQALAESAPDGLQLQKQNRNIKLSERLKRVMTN